MRRSAFSQPPQKDESQEMSRWIIYQVPINEKMIWMLINNHSEYKGKSKYWRKKIRRIKIFECFKRIKVIKLAKQFL